MRRPRSGRSVDEVGAQRMVTIPAKPLMQTVVRLAGDGLRHGVDARIVRARFAQTSTGSIKVVDPVEIRRRKLENDLTAARALRDRATRFAQRMEDEEQACEWADVAHREKRRVVSLEAQLAQPVHTPQLQAVFASDVAVFETALEKLARCEDRLPADAVDHLARVLVDLRVDVNHLGEIHVEFKLRIPVETGTLILGPFRGQVDGVLRRDRHIGRVAPSVTLDGGAEKISRSHLRAKLAAAGLDDTVAGQAVQCPHPQLWALLIVRLVDGEKAPAFLEGAWLDEPWSTWIVEQWLSMRATTKTRYLCSAPAQQFVADFVAARGGECSIGELAAAMPNNPSAAETLSKLRKNAHPPVLVVEHDDNGEPVKVPSARRLVRSVPCRCGGIATDVVVALDVPRNLLCACGRMPDAEKWGLDPDARFPDGYNRMRCPADLTIAQMRLPRDRTTSKRTRLLPSEVRVALAPPFSAKKGGGIADAAEVLGVPVGNAACVTRRMVEHGLLVKQPKSRPHRYRVTPEALEQAVVTNLDKGAMNAGAKRFRGVVPVEDMSDAAFAVLDRLTKPGAA